MRTKTVVWIVGSVCVVAILAVALSVGGRQQIAGNYDLFAAGSRTDTSVSVVPKGRTYLFTMKGSAGLEAQYLASRSRANEYVLEGRVDGKVVARYELHAQAGNLVGSAYVLPIGRLDVELRKIK